MGQLIFLFICLVLGTQEPAEPEDSLNVTQVRQWMTAVEEIISRISLGPLKQDFTPEYVGKRTAEFVQRKQTNHFRALVASSIIQASTEDCRVCIDSTQTAESAVKTVIAELKERTFDVLWLHSMDECLGRAGLLIKVPPAAVNSQE